MLSNEERKAAARSGSRMMHGGFTDVPDPSPEECALLDALTDTLIPPEDGWPPAAQLHIAPLAIRYLVPDNSAISFYPGFTRGEFTSAIHRNAAGLAKSSTGERTELLAAFESRDPELFGRIRDFIYYIYYGHPNVVELIRQRSRYGKDFHGRPQPIGYDAVLENWGIRLPTTRGTFIPTDAVLRAPQARKANA